MTGSAPTKPTASPKPLCMLKPSRWVATTSTVWTTTPSPPSPPCTTPLWGSWPVKPVPLPPPPPPRPRPSSGSATTSPAWRASPC